MRILRLILHLIFLLAIATPAHAYIGPGAGLSMLGSLLAIVVALALALLGLIVLPVRILIKKLKGR